jgi:hypothetical protein
MGTPETPQTLRYVPSAKSSFTIVNSGLVFAEFSITARHVFTYLTVYYLIGQNNHLIILCNSFE